MFRYFAKYVKTLFFGLFSLLKDCVADCRIRYAYEEWNILARLGVVCWYLLAIAAHLI